MDIYCPRCAEPIDADELHSVYDLDNGKKLSYQVARQRFFSGGCGLLFDGQQCEDTKSLRGLASSIAADLLGDDVDGIAAMLEDFDYLGMLD